MQQGPRMTNDSCDTVVFDLGGVLIDWDPATFTDP
jgi:FMN phosphatase YigB (HAD superfamily)